MTKVIIHEAHVQGDEHSGYRPTCRCGWAGATVVSFDVAWDAWKAHQAWAILHQGGQS